MIWLDQTNRHAARQVLSQLELTCSEADLDRVGLQSLHVHSPGEMSFLLLCVRHLDSWAVYFSRGLELRGAH